MPLNVGPQPRGLMQYHVFVASPGDVDAERKAVRAFFDAYNVNFAEARGLRFEVVDWENYSSAGVGRPQELITKQTLERYKESLALVVGIMSQRFGSNSGTHESGTEEEFEWAVRSAQSGFPEVKWFFRDVDQLTFDPADPDAGLAQWKKVQAFRKRIEVSKSVYSRTYKDLVGFRALLENDVGRWLNSLDRPWYKRSSQQVSASTDRLSASTDWPADVVARLASELHDDFSAHMRAGETISAAQARARYVPGLLKLRRDQRALFSATSNDPLPGTEGLLEDLVAVEGAQLLVIGPGGGGKTTMLKHLAANGARRAAEDSSAPVFVYLRLASFDRTEGGLDALLNALSIAARLERKEFEARWRGGSRPMAVLLDGLNEVARAYRSLCAQALWTLLQSSHARHRYVITSRPSSDLEILASQSTESYRLRLADLREFGPEQVEQYLTAQGRTDLQSRFSEHLRALAANPFLLWAITRTLATFPDIKNRGSLFEALIDKYIFETRERAKGPRASTDYDYQLVKKPILSGLALTMIEDGVTEIAEGPALLVAISTRLRDLAKQADDHQQPFEASAFMPRDYSAAALVRETVDNGVLVREAGYLRFMHESVQEYFAAAALRDSSLESLTSRTPRLSLAQLEARGSMFETLVTWAGLAKPDLVAGLVDRLVDAHPLLAAHLATEAELPRGNAERLRRQFLSFTLSEHEQRKRLGLMGLAIVPSDDPEIVRALTEMLDDPTTSDLAERALKRMPTKAVLSALLGSWSLDSDGDIHDKRAEILRELAAGHSRSLAEALVDAWRATEAPRDRLVKLTAFLDAKERWEATQPSTVADMLITLSAEADLGGDPERSASIDALLRRVRETPVPKVGLKALVERLTNAVETIRVLTEEREQAAAACARMDDEMLVRALHAGPPLERNAALDELVIRKASAAVAPAVELAINTREAKWLAALESLPRGLVQRQLAEQLTTLDGDRLERARVLADLVAEEPACAVLERVFESSSVALRAFAARAAGRAGPGVVEVLARQAAREVDGSVLEAILDRLGRTCSSEAGDYLLDLLFERARRQGWPTRYGDSISDAEGHARYGSDGWTTLIHDALAKLGEADRTLDRVADHLSSQNGYAQFDAVQEAGRWLPFPRAAELLERAMSHRDVDVARWAKWTLACAGHTGAWRALLQMELDTPPDFVGFAQDAARRLQVSVTESSTRDALIASSQAVLRPALTSADKRRRASAVDLTARLPQDWVEDHWARDVLAAAEQLSQSPDAQDRQKSVGALRRFAEDGETRILELWLNDPDDNVARHAAMMLRDRSTVLLEESLQNALREGNGHDAGRIGARIWAHFDTQRRRVAEQSIAKYLDSDDLSQSAAALSALTTLPVLDDDSSEHAALVKRTRAALERHGVEQLWRQFAVTSRALGQSERGFIHVLLNDLDDDPQQEETLLRLAEELWPEDLTILGSHVLAYLRRGDRERAAERLTAIARSFPDKVSHEWLGDRFAELDRPSDALRHYRRAAESNPSRAEIHFAIGWWSFVTGDYKGSEESTLLSLKSAPSQPMAEFNLAITLLAQGDTAGARAAYSRGIALAKRQSPEKSRELLDSALGDFALLPTLPEGTKAAVDHIRAWLEGELDRLEAGAMS